MFCTVSDKPDVLFLANNEVIHNTILANVKHYLYNPQY